MRLLVGLGSQAGPCWPACQGGPLHGPDGAARNANQAAINDLRGAGQNGRSDRLAAELRPAFDHGNLEYARVKAVEGKGAYAGAVLEYFKI